MRLKRAIPVTLLIGLGLAFQLAAPAGATPRQGAARPLGHRRLSGPVDRQA